MKFKDEVRDVVAAAIEMRQRTERLRPAGEFRIQRAAGDSGDLTFSGYATVFDVEYEMYGGPPWGWDESVDPSATDKTLREKPDVQFLINHSDLPLARTKSGTLRLAADNTGLDTSASFSGRSNRVQELAIAMDRRDIDEMSFAFRVMRQEWNEDYTKRRLLELSLHRGDVSIVNYGANPATSGTLRGRSNADIEQLFRAVREGGFAEREPGSVFAELRSCGITDGATLASVREVVAAVLSTARSDGPPEVSPLPDPRTGISLNEARAALEAIPA